MKIAAGTAGLALVLALGACGGGDNAADQTTVTTDGAMATPAATDTPGVTPTDSATPAPTDSATPGATPTPTTSASPSATPTPSATPSSRATVAAAAATKPPEFAICSACHSVEPGKNGIGPTLAGVFGAKAGHISGFAYSDALKASGLTWNQANLDRYLADPKGTIPGNKMAYGGLKDAAKRQAMIDYLKTL